MRILFVWPAVRMSVWDVAVGYRKTLAAAIGEENIQDFFLDVRMHYHRAAAPESHKRDDAYVSKFATEAVLAEALYFNADVVLIFSGLNFHAAGLWLLERAKIPAVVVFTESPYEDEYQAEWASASPALLALTNDSASAQQYGWTYLPHAFDPATHKPGEPVPYLPQHDVVFVGAGWPERQAFLESVDWTGINFGLYGIGFQLAETSPLRPFYIEGTVKNTDTAQIYRNSKICINLHRHSLTAESMGPRSYEIAACGTFQLSDRRSDITTVFRYSVDIFATAAELRGKILYYLENEFERKRLASKALTAVATHTFAARTPLLLDTLTRATQVLKETV